MKGPLPCSGNQSANPRRHGGGVMQPLGFSENNSRTDWPIVAKLGIPFLWKIVHLPWKVQGRTYHDLWPVTWFTGSCQAKFLFRTVSTSEACEFRYFCWWYGHACTPPAVAMVHTKVKPILFSGECYMGNWGMKVGAIDPQHREGQANMS